MIIESDDSLRSVHLHLEIVSASFMPDVVYDRHYSVSLSVDIVKHLTQSVEALASHGLRWVGPCH